MPEKRPTTADPAWNISPPSLTDYTKSLKDQSILPADAEFSILKNAVRDENVIAELAAATGISWISELVTLPPRRMGFLETCAIIETEVRLKEEDDLAPVMLGIYNDAVKPALKQAEVQLQQAVESEAQQWARESIQRVIDGNELPEDAETKKLHTAIQTRLASGQYTPGEYAWGCTTDEALLMVVQDKKYNQLMQQRIIDLVEPLVQSAIDDRSKVYPMHNSKGEVVSHESLRRLSLHAGNDRHTFMMAGAPACGKGTVVGMMAVKALEHGIEWSDTVKINTDVHRNIVSSGAELGEITEYHSELNNDEAFYITQRAYQRMDAKIKNGSAPHMLIDGVYPAPNRLAMGTENNGQLHVGVVTVPVDVSMQRAYSRGAETNRYCTSSYIIQSHQGVSRDLHMQLSKFAGKNLEYEIYDTNVPRGSMPVLFERGDLATRAVTILDPARAGEFHGKKNLNAKATSKAELFPEGAERSSLAYIDTLQNAGIQVDVVVPKRQQAVAFGFEANKSARPKIDSHAPKAQHTVQSDNKSKPPRRP